MYKIYMLGLGPGHKDYILPITKKIIKKCDVITGGTRHLESIDIKSKQTYVTDGRLSELPKFLEETVRTKDIAVIVSGDTGFYSLTKYILRYMDTDLVEVIPGISSMQYMFSKLKLSWDDAFISSMHGRKVDFIDKRKKYKKIGLLTDSIKNSPQVIARQLIENGFNDCVMYVGENLSYDNEKITEGAPANIVEKPQFDMSVVVIKFE